MHPATTHELTGHAASVFADLERAIAAGRLPHGILLSGPQGIGKATLAYAVAHKLLGEGEGVLSRILAGSHTDLLVIEPLYDEKKEEFAKDISVEQTRKISEFLSLTAGEGTWRVVIIDGAEAMNNAAANAILKILEEPPLNVVLILIAHHASRLLPTIRSRCQMFRIPPLSPEEFMTILRRQSPEISRQQASLLGAITDYSPGLAAQLHAQGAIEWWEQLGLIFEAFPALPHARMLAMAEQVASGKQHQNWRMFSRLVLHHLSTQASTRSSAQWAEKWQQTSDEFALVEARHLDYKSAVISFFHRLSAQDKAA